MADERREGEGYRNGGKGADQTLLRLFVGEPLIPATSRPSLLILEQKVRLLERLILSALERGDWNSAARWEEEAALTEHRTGLLRDGLESIFSES